MVVVVMVVGGGGGVGGGDTGGSFDDDDGGDGGGGGGDRNGNEVYDDEMLSCRDLFQYILPSTSRSPKGLFFLLQYSSPRNFI